MKNLIPRLALPPPLQHHLPTEKRERVRRPATNGIQHAYTETTCPLAYFVRCCRFGGIEGLITEDEGILLNKGILLTEGVLLDECFLVQE